MNCMFCIKTYNDKHSWILNFNWAFRWQALANSVLHVTTTIYSHVCSGMDVLRSFYICVNFDINKERLDPKNAILECLMCIYVIFEKNCISKSLMNGTTMFMLQSTMFSGFCNFKSWKIYFPLYMYLHFPDSWTKEYSSQLHSTWVSVHQFWGKRPANSYMYNIQTTQTEFLKEWH